MKKTILLFVALLIGSMSYAQNAYNGFNFKGLLTNNGNPVTSQVDVKVSINSFSALTGTTTTVWEEEHTNVQPDSNGIFSISIGQGTRTGGTVSNFDDIYFGSFSLGSVYYNVDVNTGSGYQTLVSHERFGAAPLAKQANKAFVLEKQYSTTNPITFDDGAAGIKFEANSNGVNYYQFHNTSTGFKINYGSSPTMILHGSVAVEIPGKLEGADSGDNDMKAYAYGEWYLNSSRHTSDNVTITRLGTGHYKVTFSSNLGNSDNYIVIGDIYVDTGFIKFSKANTYIDIHTYDTSGTATDKSFTFVVFKK